MTKTYQVGDAIFHVSPEGDVEYSLTPEQFLLLAPKIFNLFEKGKLQGSERERVKSFMALWAAEAATCVIEEWDEYACSFSASTEAGIKGVITYNTSGIQLEVEGNPSQDYWDYSDFWEGTHNLSFSVKFPKETRKHQRDRDVRECLGIPVSRLSKYQKMVQKCLAAIHGSVYRQ